MESLRLTIQTWHGIPIEVEKNNESITITTYNLPWFLEIFLWIMPTIIILAILRLQIPVTNIFNLIIFWSFLLIGILGFLGIYFKRFHPFLILLTKPIAIIHRTFGIRHKLIFSNSSEEYLLPSRRNVYNLEDVYAVGFHGYNNARYPAPYFQINFLVVQIVLLLKNGQILPIGGIYGYFFMATLSQKHEFEQLYVFLAKVFDFGIVNINNLAEDNLYRPENYRYFHPDNDGQAVVNGYIIKNKVGVYSCSFKRWIGGGRNVRFTPRWLPFINIGLLEQFGLLYGCFSIVLVLVEDILNYFSKQMLFLVQLNLSTDLIMTDLLVAVMFRFVYMVFWSTRWMFKKFPQDYFFNFSEYT